MNLVLLIVCAVNCDIYVEGAFEGEFCDQGICKNIRSCPAAIQDIRKGIQPATCGYDKSDVIVCCKNTQPENALSTTKRPEESVPEYILPEYDYEDLKGEDGCGPIPSTLTSKPTGQKAWDKCIEYQEKYVFPCEKGTSLSGEWGRVNRCHHNADELIVGLGGVDALHYEFPHMVLLGYQDNQNNLNWECGGSLISEKFVLTAAHCISNKLRYNVSHALVGILNRKDENVSNRFGIKRIIVHEEYHSPIKYNDIALLELDRDVPLSDTRVPACLHTGEAVNDRKASTTGWGATAYNTLDANAETLQKVVVSKFTFDECSEKYDANRNMLKGVDYSAQICYGDWTESKDSCQGDSGGPLQVKSARIACMYTVIGVTSFGQACGYVGIPGIYTRVSNYIQWIEGIVWPD